MNTINIMITASTLCDFLGGKFSLYACEAICDYLAEAGDNQSWLIGDIAISFYEADEEELKDFEEENVITKLDNGMYLVMQ